MSRDLNKMVKRGKNEADHRRKTIYDIEAFKPNVEESEENGPRRSKRTKIDQFSAPIYQFEEMTDYDGKKIIVQQMVGVTKKNYANKYCQLMSCLIREQENQKKKKKSNLKNKKEKKRKRSEAEDVEGYSENEEGSVAIETQSVHETLHIGRGTQDQTIDLSGWEKGAVNESQETIIFEQEGDGETEDNPRKKVFCFRDRLVSKRFERCYPGVSLHVMTSSDGILCIDPLGETKTQNHSNQVNYYLQKGGPAVLSLNDNVSRHKQGDLIKIPKGKSFFFVFEFKAHVHFTESNKIFSFVFRHSVQVQKRVQDREGLLLLSIFVNMLNFFFEVILMYNTFKN